MPSIGRRPQRPSNRFAFVALSTLTILMLSTLALADPTFPFDPQQQPLAGSTVKITVGNAHGSGVHIGNGFIVTAAHVTGAGDGSKASKSIAPSRAIGDGKPTGKTVVVNTDTGKEFVATVLWENKVFDIALVVAPVVADVKASPLSCRVPAVNESITAVGNPFDVDFATTHGTVAALAGTYGFWRSVVPVNIAVLPGMSGGPEFDRRGRVVGITVGVTGDYSFGYAVPASVVCNLLGR